MGKEILLRVFQKSKSKKLMANIEITDFTLHSAGYKLCLILSSQTSYLKKNRIQGGLIYPFFSPLCSYSQTIQRVITTRTGLNIKVTQKQEKLTNL